ncbi:BA14K-like protein [Bradyrhizobium erythrophlei]|jgi:hypothetical protein|uniref:Lectin-like protein BA14k n=1 Tax=Bradyrhizobium erythrophlei TaxID=1437360 RepID=A0A1M5INY3_9BRAD|nr:BA14K-like protein [Bradyrhizobium erythrophlei]
MKHLSVFLLTVTSSAALAQTTGTVNPSRAPAEPSVKEDVPPGACMPIGLTASGEIVFPIQCKEFIERQRGKAVEQKPAAEGAPAQAAKQPDSAPPPESKPVAQPVEALPLPKKRVEQEPGERAKSPEDGHRCLHYRSYNAESGTYTGFDGQRHSCP